LSDQILIQALIEDFPISLCNTTRKHIWKYNASWHVHCARSQTWL